MISTANVTMQCGAKPLFENISAKFGNGNRYGLIGANGCGKSTFMKILDGTLSPSAGNVSATPNARIATLHQDQFAFEKYSVADTVIMGHAMLWDIKQQRERIYALPEMSEADGMAVAELEIQFSELDGYSAESRAEEILMGAGIGPEFHYGPMSAVAPGWKLNSGCSWPRLCFQSRIYYCSMSPPTIWIFTPFVGWKTSLTNPKAP